MSIVKDRAAGLSPPTYLELREELLRRDRSLREKVVSLEEAASFVRDGDSVGIGGSTMSRTPMGMIWALIRAGRKGLSCSRSITSSDGDLLLASGVCDHIITSWFSQSILWGVSKVMRHHVETGKARFDEWSHMAIGMRFRAGAMGLPFMPIRSMLGSDVLKQRPEAKEIECPFTGEKLLLVPALNPDVALIHVQRCDAYGNAQMDGLQFMDIDLAMAANKVILTTERIVSNDQIRRAPDATKIPFFAVDAVVELPFGNGKFAIADGQLHLTRGEAEQAAAKLETDPQTLAALLYRRRTLDDVLRTGEVTISGDSGVVARFFQLFPLPEPASNS